MRTAAVSAGAVAAGGVFAACDRPTGPEHDHEHGQAPGDGSAARGGGAPATRNPLRIPATVVASATPSAIPLASIPLACAPGTADLGGGKFTTAWMYNGQFPGPTLVAKTGEQTSITLTNGLPQESITHWHGMLVAHEDDGHPHQVRPPGGSYQYDFPIAQRACLNWYHPHPHMLTGEQVYRGLAGAFIVRDAQDTGSAGNAFGLPSGKYEVPLIIRDASFDSRGDLSFGNKSSGFFGNTPLVNGTRDPFLAVDPAVYRFRVLNGCNARVLRLALPGGHPFALIGNDGGFIPGPPTSLAEITLAPGERADLLVDLRGLKANETIMLRCLAAGWSILELRRTGDAAGTGAIPGSLPDVPLLGAPVTTRRFTFDGMTRINGKVYGMDRIDFRVPFGTTERWVFVTNGNGPHPVHVHGAYFQVQTRTGGRGGLFAWERGWKDTVLVADGETVEVLIRFTAHRGLYVIHCHQLAHEDNGMMSNFEVF